MSTAATTNISQLLESIIGFEEAFSDYYRALAEVSSEYSDFWASAALQKETRINLFSSILNDYNTNKTRYATAESQSGHISRLTEKLKTSSVRIKETRIISNEIIEFLRQLEEISLTKSSFPRITADTELFRKANTVLDRMQEQQVRLLHSFVLKSQSGRLAEQVGT